MKKIFFLLTMLVLCITGGYAQTQPNIYASGLNAGTPANGKVTISYTLNANATALAVNFVDVDYVAATVNITDAALLTKGAHTATISLETVPQGTFTWTVTATGATIGGSPIKVGGVSVFKNTQRLAIDNDPNHSTFGRIYVVDAGTSSKGIWVFKPDLSLVNATPYAGSVAWGTSVTASPKSATVAPDGKVYISDWSDLHAGVWIMDNENPSTNFTQVFASFNSTGTPTDHGSIIQSRVLGTGAATRLYTIDEDIQKFVYYNIGATTLPWSASQPPSGIITVSSPGILPTATLNFVPDGQNGWWYLQSRAAESSTQPALMHISSTGTVDFNSYDRGLAIGNTGTGSAALAINADNTLLAIGAAGNIKVYEISDVPASPSLTQIYSFAHSIGTAAICGIEFDVAGNLYATTYSTAAGSGTNMYVYSLPKDDNTFTTPAPTASMITVAPIELNPVVTKTGYAWNTGNASRDAAVYDGKVYAIDNSGKIHVIDGTTGDENTADLITNPNLQCYTITSDGAGKLYVPSNNTGGSTAWSISTVDLLNANTISTLPYASSGTVGNSIRTDYIEVYKADATTTYIAGPSSTNTGTHLRVWSTDGATVSAPLVNVNNIFTASGNDVAWIDATHLIMTGQSQIPKYVTIDTSAGTASATNIGSTATTVGGSTYFVLDGTPYLVLPDAGLGAIKIFDITNPASPVQIGSTTAAIGTGSNGALHVAIESIVSGNTATIYVWSPNNGLAVHKLTVHPVPQPPATGPQKTFTVTAPNGTEHVYIAGTFTDKTWELTNPYELTPTGNPNEFSGTLPCDDGVEYLYYCEKGDADYVEGVLNGNDIVALSTNRSIATGDATDVIPYWYNVKKINFAVTFNGVAVPSQLSVRIWPNGEVTPTDVVLTRSGSTYTGTFGGSAGNKFGANTKYKYFLPTATPIWENHTDREATILPAMVDEITGFIGAPEISGIYYVPKSGDQRGWDSLQEAFGEINTFGIVGDVTLLIAANMTTPNLGLLNASNYNITIRPDVDESRTITFTQTSDNTGPSGAFVIGVDNAIDWNFASAKNITIDGYADASSTNKMTILSAGYTGAIPIVILNDADNVTIKNCNITTSQAISYAVYLRSRIANGSYMPKDIVLENNVITNTVKADGQGIYAYADAEPATKATGVVIKDNIINVRSRAMFLSYLNGADITGNELHVQMQNDGTNAYGIWAYLASSGTWNISGNKFIDMQTGNGGVNTNDAKFIHSTLATPTFIIENNYFSGFKKTRSGAGTKVSGIHISAAAATIRHNTFLLNNPGYAADYSAIIKGTGATTIENNLFVSDYDAEANTFIAGGDATANNNVFVIANDNAQAQVSSGLITGTNVTIEEVIFVNANDGNLDLTGASDGDGNLAVPFLSTVPKDIHGTERNTPLAYAGAFEGDVFTTGLPTKAFTVIAPEGTEHVYAAGTFTVKIWNIDKPFELKPTGNPNEFSGNLPCVDGVEYLYICEKGDWDYVEGFMDMNTQSVIARTVYRTIASGDETFDEIPYWFRVKKINFEVTFKEGLTIPAQLSAHVIDHQNTSFDLDFTKSGNTFTSILGGYDGAKYGTASMYKYFIPSAQPIWEDHEYRNIAAPKMTDVITGYFSGMLSGVYYIPNTGEQRGWTTLEEAFLDINTIGISGDVTLLITSDLTSSVNVGLINNTDYSITIRPDADADRTITFNQTDFDNAGPWGSLCLGIGSSIAWSEVAPAKHITIDGYAQGGSTRRLKITTAPTHWAGNFPILILDASTDISIKNCIIEHIGKTTGSSTYGIYLRTNPNVVATGNSSAKVMPTNVTIENNEIINTTGSSSQGIGVYADAAPITPASGIVVKDNIIRARTRGIFVNDINGMEITGNEFHINQTSGGLLSSAIYANSRIDGIFYVTQNKFVELKTANISAGDYGIKAIITGGANSTWYIDNNYFTGFDKTVSTNGTSMLQAIRLGALAGSYIRHNTFYLNELTNKPGNTGTGASDPTYSAINIAAGTPVIQNNLFVSNEDACPNYLIRGNATEATDNNVFCLQAGSTQAKIATGTVPSDLKTVTRVAFKDAAAGNLDLTGTSVNDRNLGVVPLAEIPDDIYGTLRSTTLAYAGAFEGAAFTNLPDNIDTVVTGDIRIVQEGNQLIITVSSGKQIQSVKLYDLQGRTIASKQGVSANVSITAPNKGAYIVEIYAEGVRNVKKYVVR